MSGKGVGGGMIEKEGRRQTGRQGTSDRQTAGGGGGVTKTDTQAERREKESKYATWHLNVQSTAQERQAETDRVCWSLTSRRPLRKDRQTGRQTDRQAGSHTDRQTDRQGATQTGRQAGRLTDRQAGTETDRQAL